MKLLSFQFGIKTSCESPKQNQPSQSNKSNIINEIQLNEIQPTSTIGIPTTANMDCLLQQQQQQQKPPILLASPNLSISNLSAQNLSISSTEIPFVIANHLSTLTPTKITGETASLILTTTPTNNISNSLNGINNNHINGGKQKWFIQSGEHINGRTCLALSSKIEDKIHTDSQQVKKKSSKNSRNIKRI